MFCFSCVSFFFFFNDTATTEIYTLHIVGSVRCVQETGINRIIFTQEKKDSPQVYNKDSSSRFYHQFKTLKNQVIPIPDLEILKDNSDEYRELFFKIQKKLKEFFINSIKFEKMNLFELRSQQMLQELGMPISAKNNYVSLADDCMIVTLNPIIFQKQMAAIRLQVHTLSQPNDNQVSLELGLVSDQETYLQSMKLQIDQDYLLKFYLSENCNTSQVEEAIKIEAIQIRQDQINYQQNMQSEVKLNIDTKKAWKIAIKGNETQIFIKKVFIDQFLSDHSRQINDLDLNDESSTQCC
eukprot:TRINITY_DN3120_c0_g1_i2.p1 TRINITY_DN3120_c0_g1~~TRINITY_DN3120_c0_g1_i2.p1  ORF type:complete len:296 (+),score=56.59 TRINITY_DN3120_c0_g1_i2:83-970(+)